MNYVSIAISIIALLVSIFNIVRQELWNKKNRINSIKPILCLNTLESYKEGYVPSAIINFKHEDGINFYIYLKLSNIGSGNASNILIELKNKNCSVVVSTSPLVIKFGEKRKLQIAIQGFNKGSLDNRDLDITVYYKDIDGNNYSVDGSIIILKKMKEYNCLTNYYGDVRRVKKMPKPNVRAKYIDEEF